MTARHRPGATRVKQLRARYGLSRVELAALMGVTVQTVRAWEIGQRRMRVKTYDLLMTRLTEGT